ncbi:MAG: hypothetical protein WA876_11270 [Candidatus Acidiferrales bacterium]
MPREMYKNPKDAQRWRMAHTEESKAYHRRRRTASYGPPATPEQQKACDPRIGDPRRSLQGKFGIVDASFVFCMLCWNRYQELGHHLPHCERLPPEWCEAASLTKKYRREFGLNSGTSLACESYGSQRRQVANAHDLSKSHASGANREKHLKHLSRIRPNNTGVAHSREASLNKSDRQRGIAFPERQTVPHESYVSQFLFDGTAAEKIARKSGTELNTVAIALKRVFGFRVRGKCVFSRGEPLTGRWLTEFAERFCLRATDLESAYGFSSGWYTQATSDARQPNPLHHSKATVLAAAERELLKSLMAVRKFLDADVLRTVCPKIPERCAYIAEVAREVVPTGDPIEWLPQLVDDSRREAALSSAPWNRRGFLCSFPSFIRFTKQFPDWRTKWAAPHELATAFLAFDYETSESTIREALANRSQAIPQLALRLAAHSALEHLPRRGGRVGLDSDTRHRIRCAAAFLRCGYTQTTMARYLFGVGDDSQEESALQSTFKLFIRHRRRIKLTKLSLSDHESRAIVAVKTTTQRKPA